MIVVTGAVSMTETQVKPFGPYKTLGAIARREFLMPDTFPQDGVLFAFIAYFVSETPVRLQVWRPVGTSSFTSSYQLACQHRIDVTRDQLSRRAVVCNVRR